MISVATETSHREKKGASLVLLPVDFSLLLEDRPSDVSILGLDLSADLILNLGLVSLCGVLQTR